MWDQFPDQGLNPDPPALGMWSLNHWTAGEVPQLVFRENHFGVRLPGPQIWKDRSETDSLGEMGQVTLPLWVSVSSSVQGVCDSTHLYGGKQHIQKP